MEKPVDVETRLPPGKPLCRKGFSSYPLVVGNALVLRYAPHMLSHARTGGTSFCGASGGNQEIVTIVTAYEQAYGEM